MQNAAANRAIFGIYRLLVFFFVLFVLYFAQAIVIPLTIAALLTFLLSPLATLLEKWLGRIGSIVVVVFVVFSVLGIAGYLFAKQLILFGANLPYYFDIIQAKIRDFRFYEGGIFNRISHVIEVLKGGLVGEGRPIDAVVKFAPEEIRLLDFSTYLATLIKAILGSLFNILWMSGIIILLVIFMLINREDLRGRLIKLMGQSKISSTTTAMKDAGERVFIYLYRLCIVNIGYGVSVSLGLSLIGIPNAILWGCLGAALRFIPYIGVWIAAFIPIALSFIITDSWITPLITISFFVVLEIIVAYFIEPFYYGVGTGISSFALIVAAIFWTWLWGPIGLLLSTPLTVILVVIGQYVTNMDFLRVLLSQEQALSPAEELYHRLLLFDSSESMDVIDAYLQKNSLVSFYDSVLIPIAAQAERDFHQELIDSEKWGGVQKGVREIVEFLGISESKEVIPPLEPKGAVLCLPAKGLRDEIGIGMIAQLLVFESFDPHYSSRLNLNETFDLLEKINPFAVCIGAVTPFVLSHIRFLCTKIRQRKPDLPIIVSLLGLSQVDPQIVEKLKEAGADHVVATLSQTVDLIRGLKQ